MYGRIKFIKFELWIHFQIIDFYLRDLGKWVSSLQDYGIACVLRSHEGFTESIERGGCLNRRYSRQEYKHVGLTGKIKLNYSFHVTKPALSASVICRWMLTYPPIERPARQAHRCDETLETWRPWTIRLSMFVPVLKGRNWWIYNCVMK